MTVDIFTENGWVQLEEMGKGYCCNDVFVEICKGKVCITAENTLLGYIRITKKNTLFSNALVMGDAWERGYGDLSWKPLDYERVLPWYFTAVENEKIFCFGVKTQPDAFCAWKCGAEKITLLIDIKNGSNLINLQGRKLEACTIVEYETEKNVYKAQKDFCRLMCEKPRLIERPVFGGNDWYCNYGISSFEKIITHTKRIVECCEDCDVKPYMVIDDGWQLCHSFQPFYNGGPWNGCNYKFEDMSTLAEKIEKIGAVPGIWFRPLQTFEDTDDRAVLRRDGFKVYMDPSSKVTLKRVSEDIKRFVQWGYKLIKHDFSTYDIFMQWGFQCSGFLEANELNFEDKNKTTAQIIKNFYKIIRESAGDDVAIMGCNTISHLAAGLFEIQRTGDDTSGKEWERTKKYGINTLAFRMSQHNTFYCADADCVGITNDINFEKNKMWLDAVAKSGTALFVSIADDAYNEEVKKALKIAYKTVCKVNDDSYPLDWMENKTPNKWKSVFGIDDYRW